MVLISYIEKLIKYFLYYFLKLFKKISKTTHVNNKVVLTILQINFYVNIMFFNAVYGVSTHKFTRSNYKSLNGLSTVKSFNLSAITTGGGSVQNINNGGVASKLIFYFFSI